MNEGRINSSLKKNNIAIIIFIDILVVLSKVMSNSMLTYLALIAFAVALLLSDCDTHLYYYISLMPMLTSFEINNINILFVFISISIVKLVWKYKKFKTTQVWIFCFAYIIILEIFYDCFNWSVGQFLNLFLVIVYVLLLLALYPWNEVDYNIFISLMIWTGILCILSSIVAASVRGVNLSAYITASENYVRFGEDESAHAFGGAMGIPIYATVAMACCYLRLVTESKKNTIQVVMYVGIIIGCAFFGLLTHSRNFILGSITLIILICFSFLISRNKIRGIFFYSLLLVVFAIIYYRNQAWFANILILFEERGRWTEDVRMRVWLDCISYWNQHPISFIIGLGAKNYTIVGRRNGFLFYMCAHNIILDGLMSWGLIGFSLFIGTIYATFKRIVNYRLFKSNIAYSIPFLTWLAMKMTSGTFEDSFEYFFIIALVNIAAHNVPNKSIAENDQV